MPWQYKIVVVSGSVFILFSIFWVPAVFTGFIGRALSDSHAPHALRLSNQTISQGMMDPSLAYDPQTKSVWLAYTGPTPGGGENGTPAALGIRLAKSQDPSVMNCDLWFDIPSGVIEGKADDIYSSDGQSIFRTGVWHVETPSLVHDPDDPGREWKIFAYKYFWPDNPALRFQVMQHYGMIVYKYTSDPAGAWSGEQWLFSPAKGFPPPPYQDMIMLHLNQLDPSLKDVKLYSRPSVVYKDGVLAMTLSAFTGDDGTPDRVIMIVSRDHGNSWLYAGTPLARADLAKIPPVGKDAAPYTELTGANLIKKDGKIYLAAVMGTEMQHSKGTFVFAFDGDFTSGALKRDPDTGAPALVSHVPLSSELIGRFGGGAAAYLDVCPIGLLVTEEIGHTPGFHLMETYKDPLSGK